MNQHQYATVTLTLRLAVVAGFALAVLGFALMLAGPTWGLVLAGFVLTVCAGVTLELVERQENPS